MSAQTKRPGDGTSLYVHVPFCVVKCGYCDFNSYTVDDESVLDRFLVALEHELEMAILPESPVSVFLGGGTPSYLDLERLERLFSVLADHVDLPACPEVSMEANPESIDRAKAELALRRGVTRISMGAQSFHARHLAFLDRIHSGERIAGAVAEIRAAGCNNLSLDLMFGLPDQALEDWSTDLEAALRLRPDHLSCYNLTFEAGTRLAHALRQNQVTPLDEEVQAAMFLLTRARLAEAGFVAYEISNFAGGGGPCLHNEHYWLQGDYVGVGPGAASHRTGVRCTNLKPVDTWAGSIARGIPPVAEAETLSPRQRAGEALWLGLRRSAGVDLDAVAERLEVPIHSWLGKRLDLQLDQGLVEFRGSALCLTDRGLLLSDAVGAVYLEA